VSSTPGAISNVLKHWGIRVLRREDDDDVSESIAKEMGKKRRRSGRVYGAGAGIASGPSRVAV
jgi:hypothetical protein